MRPDWLEWGTVEDMPFVKLEPWTFPKASGKRFHINNCLGRRLGFLGSSYERDCSLGGIQNYRAPNHQFWHLLIQTITKQQRFLRQKNGRAAFVRKFQDVSFVDGNKSE